MSHASRIARLTEEVMNISKKAAKSLELRSKTDMVTEVKMTAVQTGTAPEGNANQWDMKGKITLRMLNMVVERSFTTKMSAKGGVFRIADFKVQPNDASEIFERVLDYLMWKHGGKMANWLPGY